MNSVTQRQVSSYCRYLVQYIGVKRQQIVRSREQIVLRENGINKINMPCVR